VDAGLLLHRQIDSSGCSATASSWPATSPAGGRRALRNELGVGHVEAGAGQHLASPMRQLKLPTSAARRSGACPSVGPRILMFSRPLTWGAAARAPELLRLHAAGRSRYPLTLASAVPCATAAVAAGDSPPSNWMMFASMQCLAKMRAPWPHRAWCAPHWEARPRPRHDLAEPTLGIRLRRGRPHAGLPQQRTESDPAVVPSAIENRNPSAISCSSRDRGCVLLQSCTAAVHGAT